MSLIRGQTLGERWDFLTRDEKKSVCGQLGQIMNTLRDTDQPPAHKVIGSAMSRPIQDNYFRDGREAGPFRSVNAFNDYVQLEAISQLPMSERPEDPYRSLLPDKGHIVFTHANLQLQNIFVSQTSGQIRIAGIVDWEQAGWYPG
ncbi:hypothetical protein B0T11DRAFT_103637 [Plectosphaerella cucumerina]|uniref:Aminoglycoside phosphotransferase domain-containing protein n=1 Tax=Plectosphaerella cucumerina TaxID=40658 RepID=A0A8K0X2G2_9PEZI|nr:hypothetical protein B0T11DRAFT_103637 [Plectosphaerella cucumerina]